MRFNHERGDYEQKKRVCLVFVFENTENIILVLFQNCFCSMNLVPFMFSVFFRIKQNWESNVFSMFSMFSLFLKIENNF